MIEITYSTSQECNKVSLYLYLPIIDQYQLSTTYDNFFEWPEEYKSVQKFTDIWHMPSVWR